MQFLIFLLILLFKIYYIHGKIWESQRNNSTKSVHSILAKEIISNKLFLSDFSFLLFDIFFQTNKICWDRKAADKIKN